MTKSKSKKKKKLFPVITGSKDYRKYTRICSMAGMEETIPYKLYKEATDIKPKREE